jgi:hypothetical protein
VRSIAGHRGGQAWARTGDDRWDPKCPGWVPSRCAYTPADALSASSQKEPPHRPTGKGSPCAPARSGGVCGAHLDVAGEGEEAEDGVEQGVDQVGHPQARLPRPRVPRGRPVQQHPHHTVRPCRGWEIGSRVLATSWSYVLSSTHTTLYDGVAGEDWDGGVSGWQHNLLSIHSTHHAVRRCRDEDCGDRRSNHGYWRRHVGIINHTVIIVLLVPIRIVHPISSHVYHHRHSSHH